MQAYKSLFTFLLLIVAGVFTAIGQPLPDPSVNGATVFPAPANIVGTAAHVSFNFINVSVTPVPATGAALAGNHINVGLSNLAVSGTFNPATYVTGPGSVYFTWTYNAASLTLTGYQNQVIPDFAGGLINFNNLVVTAPSPIGNPQVGLNVNVVFLGAYNASTVNDNTSSFTYTLPVLLTNFNYKVKDCGVNLTWSTSQEINSKDFVVENSVNGTSWTAVGIVGAKGNSSSVSNYSFVHPNPIPGTNYYRLGMEDRDGHKSYSPILNVNVLCSKPVITINPNPFVDKVNIYMTSAKDEMVNIKLFDNIGREIQSKQVSVLRGSNVIDLHDLRNLASGVYLIRVATNSDIVTQKLVKE